MLKQANVLVLSAAAVLLGPAAASAALFEMQHALPAASVADTRLPPRAGMANAYRAALLDHAGILQFPSLKSEIAMSEDLLWIALGNARPFGLRAVQREPEMIYSLSEEPNPLHPSARHAHQGRSPATEGNGTEIWAAMLIGAGLILFQLRRNTRSSAIRFRNT